MLRRSIAYAVFLLYLTACTTWHTSDGASLKELLATQHPNALRVTTTGGSSKLLRFLSIVAGDTLVGYHRGEPSRIAVSDIKQVAIPKPATGKTIALAVGIMAVFAVSGVVLTNRDKNAGGEPLP